MRRWIGGTLRTRLTLGFMLVLLVATVAIGIVTTLFLRGFLLGRLDSQLTQAGGRFSASLEQGPPAPGGSDGDADNATPGQSVGTLGVRLVGGRVQESAVVEGDGENATPVLDGEDARDLADLPVGGAARSVDLSDLGDYRLQAVAGMDGDVLVSGLPLEDVDETLARLVTVEVAVFAVAVLVGGLATTFLVRRTLRPLETLSAVAREVSDLPLTDAATPLPQGLAPEHPRSEVDEVSTAFDHMLDHIRSALTARDTTEARLRQFVADASHELRTPLATIRAHTEFAARDADGLPLPVSTALGRIDIAADRMASLVEDLLLLARLDAGRSLQQEPVDLTHLVVEAVVDARPLAPDHVWRLALPDDGVEVIGDERQLHQVIANLVSNARHHTPPGTTVDVSLVADRAREVVTLVVADDGPGIPSELQDGLFDRFTRGDVSRTTGHGSSGLGLAIAQGVVAAHGGELDVVSRPGETRFRVRLPLVRDETSTTSRALKTL